MGDKTRWDSFYVNSAKDDGNPPPWESNECFTPLLEILDPSHKNSLLKLLASTKDTIPSLNVIEIGSGCSVSIITIAKLLSCRAVAVDISPKAIDRAKEILKDSNLVDWICADLLNKKGNDRELTVGVQFGAFDFVLDQQCYHCLHSIDAKQASSNIVKLLKVGGIAMIVTGAPAREGETDLEPGPVILTRDEVSNIFSYPSEAIGGTMQLIELNLRRFNITPTYQRHSSIPSCWVSLWRKIDLK
jgi:SAM-dependent methyltransferase